MTMCEEVSSDKYEIHTSIWESSKHLQNGMLIVGQHQGYLELSSLMPQKK